MTLPMHRVMLIIPLRSWTFPEVGEIMTETFPEVKPSTFYWYMVNTSEEQVGRLLAGILTCKCIPVLEFS